MQTDRYTDRLTKTDRRKPIYNLSHAICYGTDNKRLRAVSFINVNVLSQCSNSYGSQPFRAQYKNWRTKFKKFALRIIRHVGYRNWYRL